MSIQQRMYANNASNGCRAVAANDVNESELLVSRNSLFIAYFSTGFEHHPFSFKTSEFKMTGLDLQRDRIIEMACIITDKNLNVIAKAPSLIIKQPNNLLDSMNDWCKEHHGKSGLIDEVKKSELTQVDAEQKMLKFVQNYTPKSACPLAGNSVHVDKMFLEKYMPNFMKHFNYRIIDVSSIKELCRRWYPSAYHTAPRKALTHRISFLSDMLQKSFLKLNEIKVIRALGDIQESIEELKYYRKVIFAHN